MRIHTKGFTLLETIIVISIIAILLGLGIPFTQRYLAQQTVDNFAQELIGIIEETRSKAITVGSGDSQGGAPTAASVTLNSFTVKAYYQQGKLLRTLSPDPGINIQLDNMSSTIVSATTRISFDSNGVPGGSYIMYFASNGTIYGATSASSPTTITISHKNLPSSYYITISINPLTGAVTVTKTQ